MMMEGSEAVVVVDLEVEEVQMMMMKIGIKMYRHKAERKARTFIGVVLSSLCIKPRELSCVAGPISGTCALVV